MKNSSLVCLTIFLFVLAASPLAGAWYLSCGSDGRTYAANSTYEANLHHLAVILPAEASETPERYVDRSIGYWPNRVQATSRCPSDGDCAACIADAFKLLEVECPFRTEAAFFSRNCSLRFGELGIFEIDLFGEQILVPGMIFQAVGLVCLFLMFLRAWRHDIKKGVAPIPYLETSKSEA